MQAVTASKLLSASCVVLLMVGLLFRAFVYGHLYLAPGEPYGISDVIELLLGSILIVFLGATAVLALVLGIKGPKHNRVAALWSSLTIIVILLVVAPLHTLVARWASA